MVEPFLATARRALYDFLVAESCLITDNGVPSIADRDSRISCAIAVTLFNNLSTDAVGKRLAGQRAGTLFEIACKRFLQQTFPKLGIIRPGVWQIKRNTKITEFYQYEHLATLAELADDNIELAAAMVSDYLVNPDVVTARNAVPEQRLRFAVASASGLRSPLLATDGGKQLLHASVSCKWTIRSDRSQNTRSEALSLIRNRKGPLPHIVAITAEPLPDRTASIALGTGDMDCVYHIALPELERAVAEVASSASQKLERAVAEGKSGRQLRPFVSFQESSADAQTSLTTMVSGKLLRDIADLPFDLCI